VPWYYLTNATTATRPILAFLVACSIPPLVGAACYAAWRGARVRARRDAYDAWHTSCCACKLVNTTPAPMRPACCACPKRLPIPAHHAMLDYADVHDATTWTYAAGLAPTRVACCPIAVTPAHTVLPWLTDMNCDIRVSLANVGRRAVADWRGFLFNRPALSTAYLPTLLPVFQHALPLPIPDACYYSMT